MSDKSKPNFWYKTIIIVSILLFLQVIGPFTKEGMFLGHDSQLHTIYFKKFEEALQAGQFPVRWIDWFKVGLNQPLFNFYQPGVYYLYQIPRFLGFGYVNSLNILVITLWLTSGLLMFLFVRRHFGTLGGILGAYFYLLAPYHILDILIRAALPEFTALTFVPGIFWGIKSYFDTKKSYYLALISLFTALVVISHPPTFIMFSLLILSYLSYLSYLRDLKMGLKALLSLLLGFGLISFFIIPAYFEQGFIQTIFLHSGYYDYHYHWVCFPQIFSTFWGNGTSTSECIDGLSLQLGLAHWIGLSLVLFVISLKFFFKKWAKKWENLINLNIFSIKDYILLFIFLGVLSITLYVLFEISKPIWDTLPYIPFIQYSWRFLAVSIFASSFLTASLLPLIKKDNMRLGLFTLLMFAATFFYSNYLKPIAYANPGEIKFGEEILHPALNIKNFDPEPGYMPRWTQIIPAENDRPANEIKTEKGSFTVKNVNLSAHQKQYMLQVDSPSTVRFYVHYYPGWKVLVDNKEVTPNYNNIYGFMDVNLEPGNRNVVLKFENTPLRATANGLSILFAILVIGLIFKDRFAKSVSRIM